MCIIKEGNMTTITFTEFRQNAKAYFDAVEGGDTVRVMRHGKIIARVVPPLGLERKPSWKEPALKLLIPGASLSQAVMDQRKESL